MRTQEEINYYFQSFAVKSAIELVKIESILEVHGIQLPNNIIIHKNGIAVAKFLNWWQNKSNYPETYEECCRIIGFCSASLQWDNPFCVNRDSHPYIKHLDILMENLCRLLICRDTYWKIAGEEMGLGKPWEPDWMDEITKYGIGTYQNIIFKDNVVHTNRILVFPTKQMQDAFYENFKDLIKSCKELL